MFDESRNGPLIHDTYHVLDGVRIRVRSGGQSRPDVILVHGLGLGSSYMMPVARSLAQDFRVHVPDLPGFGASDDPDHVLDFGESAEVLGRWMEEKGLESAAVLGNSLGCNVSVELALRHPERVESLILQGPTFDPAGRNMLNAFGRFLLDPQRPVIPLGIREYPRAGLYRVYRNVRMMLDHPIEARLPAVHAPTLVVRGTRDRLVPQDWVERMVTLLPDGELRVVPGQGHVMVYTGALELARIARPFIRRHHRAFSRVPE